MKAFLLFPLSDTMIKDIGTAIRAKLAIGGPRCSRLPYFAIAIYPLPSVTAGCYHLSIDYAIHLAQYDDKPKGLATILADFPLSSAKVSHPLTVMICLHTHHQNVGRV